MLLLRHASLSHSLHCFDLVWASVQWIHDCGVPLAQGYVLVMSWFVLKISTHSLIHCLSGEKILPWMVKTIFGWPESYLNLNLAPRFSGKMDVTTPSRADTPEDNQTFPGVNTGGWVKNYFVKKKIIILPLPQSHKITWFRHSQSLGIAWVVFVCFGLHGFYTRQSSHAVAKKNLKIQLDPIPNYDSEGITLPKWLVQKKELLLLWKRMRWIAVLICYEIGEGNIWDACKMPWITIPVSHNVPSSYPCTTRGDL